jgi:single-stranded-DNA-specific exonuclease
MLIRRGFRDPTEASSFLNPSLEDMHDPNLMQDMEVVVQRLFRARSLKEKVFIYGDYDVDGITSTVILKRALEMLGLEVGYHIPRRLEEGYGLKAHVVEQAHQSGYSLIITTDSGIRAFEVCQVARELGVDLVVTDHHSPDTTLPEAYAIINPRRSDCNYPDKSLAAVGVVFKLVQALFEELGWSSRMPHFLKLVAIGTIADLVPLLGENRIFTKFGLDGLSKPINLGLRTLLRSSGVTGSVSTSDIGFKIAPRINAVTRMGGGGEVVDLFSIQDQMEVNRLVEDMHTKNVDRRKTEQVILEEIERRFKVAPKEFEGNFLIVTGEGWHRGVIGIIASRLVEKFYRPTLVISIDQAQCQASGRSIRGFNLLDALTHCRDLLDRFGGHEQAVGCSMPESVLQELGARLRDYAEQTISEEALIPILPIETEVSINEIGEELLNQVEKLEPFGKGNPMPIFLSRDVPLRAAPYVIKKSHLKLLVGPSQSPFEAIWWRHAEIASQICQGSRLDIAYRLGWNSYRGVKKIQLTIEDLRIGENL